jgi:glutathione reductase (NADPH)
MSFDYELFVIGAGPGGLAAAERAAQYGVRVAIAAGRAFADTEFGNNPHVVDYEGVPYVVASNPEAATVGLTEVQACEKWGESVRCYRKTFQSLFHMRAQSPEKTLLKLVVDSNSDRVLGTHMVGENAAEIIQMIALAIKAGVTKADF